jgi:carbon storage regulator
MLVVARKPGQSITVDGQAVITLVEMRSGTVRIGIEAPPTTKVLRTELLEREEAEA